MADTDIERAAAQARRAVQLALLCVVIAAIVLLIDNSIKRAILKARDEALLALADLNVTAGQVMNGRQQVQGTGDPGGDAGAGGEPGVSVGDPSPGSEDVAAAPVVADIEPAAKRAGGAGGPRGNA